MDLSKLSDADLDALQAGDLSKLSDEGLAHLSAPTQVPTKPKSSILDAPNAVASGFDRGLVRFAGLPVDTLANVVDLVKAGAGSAYTKATGKVPSDLLQLAPREDVVGSGDWLLKQAGKNKVTSALVNPANPSYEGGYLQAAGGGISGLMNPTGLRDAATQTARNVAGAVLGKATGDITGSTEAAVLASLAPALLSKRSKPVPTQKSEVLAAAQKEGYVIPPSQGGAGWVNNRLESIAGKAALNQDAIKRNQLVTDRVGARSVGIAPGRGITSDALADLRAEAGRRGYAPIDRIGDIPITPNYANRILAMENDVGNPTSSVSSLRYPAVSTLATELLPTHFTGPDINGLIKQLRETGNKGANIPYGGDQAAQKLGQAQIQGSRALEGLVDEHLLQFGPSNIVPNLRAARQEIAQAHTLEKALNPATGDVNAHVFGQRVLDAKPLSGDQKVIGDFAAAFPQVTKPAAGTPTPGVSALEAVGVPAAALAGALATGNVHGMLAGGVPLLRAPVRNMLLSNWYQKKFAKQNPQLTSLSPEEVGALSKFLTTSGVLEDQ